MLPKYELNNVSRRLKQLGFKNLSDYCSSPLWKTRRAYFEARNGKEKCECCDLKYVDLKAHRETMHLHHRTYKNLGAEPDKDLCWLCQNCHEDFHMRANEIIESVESGESSSLFANVLLEMSIQARHFKDLDLSGLPVQK